MNRHVRIGIVVLTAAAFLTAAWWGSGNSQAQQAGGWVQLSAASRPAASAPASGPASASAPAVRAVHAFGSGKVQGGGFRGWAVGEAKGLKLTGWVKNLPDGRVEAVIEGPAEAVATLLERLKKGPSTAKVEKVESTDEKPTGEFKDFQQR